MLILGKIGGCSLEVAATREDEDDDDDADDEDEADGDDADEIVALGEVISAATTPRLDCVLRTRGATMNNETITASLSW